MIDVASFAPCQDCLCLSARRTAHQLTRAYDERLRVHGLTINQFSMLTTLILAGPLTMVALADYLGVDRTTLTRNVKLGEARGLVSIGRSKDARERLVSITSHGRVVAEAALPDWRAVQQHFLEQAKPAA